MFSFIVGETSLIFKHLCWTILHYKQTCRWTPVGWNIYWFLRTSAFRDIVPCLTSNGLAMHITIPSPSEELSEIMNYLCSAEVRGREGGYQLVLMHVGGARKGPLNILCTRGRAEPKKPFKISFMLRRGREFRRFFVSKAGHSTKILLKLVIISEGAASFRLSKLVIHSKGAAT